MIATNKIRRSKEFEDKLRGLLRKKPLGHKISIEIFNEAYKFHCFKIDSTDHVKYVILNERV